MRRGRPKGGPQTAVRSSQFAGRSSPSRQFMVYKHLSGLSGHISWQERLNYTKGCLCFVIIYH